MRTGDKRNKARKTISTIVSPDEWSSFLSTFNDRHHGWLVELETYDVVTREKVVSREMPLQSIELDLEDEKNPLINVTVQGDNKVIKHILFRPSRLIVTPSNDGQEQLFQVETVNTETTIRLRAPIPNHG